MHLSFGMTHMMATDRFKQLYGWGEATYGCLGFGDNRKKVVPVLLPFFDGKRVIDVSCGDCFTVVIAEVDPDHKLKEHKVFEAKDLENGAKNQ